ncbi:MAG: hypothetical protein ABSH20_06855 [Tepidisphaeraceae bacterium]|jgi:hypothetical protein
MRRDFGRNPVNPLSLGALGRRGSGGAPTNQELKLSFRLDPFIHQHPESQ